MSINQFKHSLKDIIINKYDKLCKGLCLILTIHKLCAQFLITCGPYPIIKTVLFHNLGLSQVSRMTATGTLSLILFIYI